MPNVKRKYVIPGEVIAEGNYKPSSNVIRMGDNLVATRVGMAEIDRDNVKVIPLSGPYIPRPDDLVIGKIVDSTAFAWEADINSCFYAYLPAQSVFGRDFSPSRESLTTMFEIGDIISARILAFDRTRDPLLSVSGPGLGKVSSGEIVKMSPTKVPRVIGKRGLMINTIESGTGCKLMIGQNGMIVVEGKPEDVLRAMEAVKLVEEEAHTADLTQKVQNLLSREGGA